jgi:hypothetical protein
MIIMSLFIFLFVLPPRISSSLPLCVVVTTLRHTRAFAWNNRPCHWEQAERAEATRADVVRREDFLVEACTKYDAAHRLRPNSHSTLYNWGIALGDRARASANTTRARGLWLEACEKYRAAVGWSLPGGVRLVTWNMEHTGCHQLNVFLTAT